MIRIKFFLSRHKEQYRILLGFTLIILSCLILLDHFKDSIFERFIGELNPIITGSCIAVSGFVFLSFLISKTTLSIYKKAHLKRTFGLLKWLIPILLVTLFIDLNIVYPEDMNIPYPESLVFYPVIAFFVEIVFHILPFTILLIFLSPLFKTKNNNLLWWILIVFVSLLEPSYQVFFMETYPIWALVILWINLYLFNVLQLYVFWRCDFISMFIFRLAYYAVWHIVWGHYRLEFLF